MVLLGPLGQNFELLLGAGSGGEEESPTCRLSWSCYP